MRGRTAHAFARPMTGAALLALLVLVTACGGAEPEADQETAAPAETAEDAAGQTATDQATATEAATQTEAATSSVLAGETIEFAVPSDPGGGYDQYSRLVAPFLADCLGASVVVVNEPGAGGLLATNQTAVSPPDGTRIQITNTPGAASSQIGGAEGVNFDLNELSWIGRLAAQPDVVSVAPDNELESFQDMIEAERPVRFAASGPGANSFMLPTVLAPVYGFELELVTGFAGSGEMQTAVSRGDTDAHVLSLDSALPLIEAGELRPLVLVGSEGSDAVPDVPAISEFPAGGETEQQIIDSYEAMVQTGRALAGPPDLPEDVLGALREGFQCAVENEEFLAQAQAAGRPIDALSGEETAELVQQVTESPDAFRELVRQSFQ